MDTDQPYLLETDKLQVSIPVLVEKWPHDISSNLLDD